MELDAIERAWTRAVHLHVSYGPGPIAATGCGNFWDSWIPATVAKPRCPSCKVVAAHEVRNSIGVNFGFQRGGEAELDELQLRRTMGIGTDRNPCIRLYAPA